MITTPIPAPSQAASVPIPVWLVPFMIISLLMVTTIVVYIVFSFIKKERLRRVHEKIVSEEAEKIE